MAGIQLKVPTTPVDNGSISDEDDSKDDFEDAASFAPSETREDQLALESPLSPFPNADDNVPFPGNSNSNTTDSTTNPSKGDTTCQDANLPNTTSLETSGEEPPTPKMPVLFSNPAPDETPKTTNDNLVSTPSIENQGEFGKRLSTASQQSDAVDFSEPVPSPSPSKNSINSGLPTSENTNGSSSTTPSSRNSVTSAVWRNSIALTSPLSSVSLNSPGPTSTGLDKTLSDKERKRRTIASSGSIDSGRNYDFILHRAQETSNLQKKSAIATPNKEEFSFSSTEAPGAGEEEGKKSDDISTTNGDDSGSGEGKAKLRQSFERIHSQLKQPEQVEDDMDWEFWGNVIMDYEHVAKTQPRELSRAIQKGIPPALRGMTWQLMSAAKDPDLESMYAQLLKETSPHEKSITRDLSRTFPSHVYFQSSGVGQDNLFNVVKAYSIYDPDVGYTQGLQFIVGPLLLNMPDEEAFCVLVRLMKSYDLRSHFVANMPGLQLRLFQFDRLLEEMLPHVFLHLIKQGVKSSMYASQWFLTLFGYRFPLELVCAVFDLVFAEGVEAVFRFSLALMRKSETKICELEFEELLDFLKSGLFESYKLSTPTPAPDSSSKDASDASEPQYCAPDFVRDALQVKITPIMLDTFANEWQEMCRQQNAHAIELENLRNINTQLSSQLRRLEANLAQVNKEHCDLVKEVVMAKLDREQLEEELVKYKLAFADLSHQQASERLSLHLSRPSSSLTS